MPLSLAKMAVPSSLDSDHESFHHIGATGEQALWISFFFLAASTVYFMFSMFAQPDGKRKFHIYTMAITGIASVAYLTMATGLGSIKDNNGREFFYARYIDWSFTTPLLLLDVAALAGASTDTLLYLMVTDALMIVSGLIGALFATQVKWLFWFIGMWFFAPIVYFLVAGLDASAAKVGTSGPVKQVAMLTAISWSAYPIVWAMAEGTSSISCDAEAILYCVLDVTAKAVFGFMIVGARDAIDAALPGAGDNAGGGYGATDEGGEGKA